MHSITKNSGRSVLSKAVIILLYVLAGCSREDHRSAPGVGPAAPMPPATTSARNIFCEAKYDIARRELIVTLDNRNGEIIQFSNVEIKMYPILSTGERSPFPRRGLRSLLADVQQYRFVGLIRGNYADHAFYYPGWHRCGLHALWLMPGASASVLFPEDPREGWKEYRVFDVVATMDIIRGVDLVKGAPRGVETLSCPPIRVIFPETQNDAGKP